MTGSKTVATAIVQRRPSRPQYGLWVVSGVALGLFVLLTVAVALAGMPYFPVDVAISRALQEQCGPVWVQAMHAISFAGDDVLWSSVLVVSTLVVLISLRARRAAVVLLGVVLVAQAVKIGVKNLVARPRPAPTLVQVQFDANEIYSFPSGHTVHYTVLFGLLWYLTSIGVKPAALRRPLLVILGGFVLSVGLARITLGAHWITDVIGGYLLGGAVLSAGIALYRIGAQATGPGLCEHARP